MGCSNDHAIAENARSIDEFAQVHPASILSPCAPWSATSGSRVLASRQILVPFQGSVRRSQGASKAKTALILLGNHQTFNQRVDGSIPSGLTNKISHLASFWRAGFRPSGGGFSLTRPFELDDGLVGKPPLLGPVGVLLHHLQGPVPEHGGNFFRRAACFRKC